jgi:hypothetical protein
MPVAYTVKHVYLVGCRNVQKIEDFVPSVKAASAILPLRRVIPRQRRAVTARTSCKPRAHCDALADRSEGHGFPTSVDGQA